MNYEFYVLDCETTGLDNIKNDPIEISAYRLSNGEQKTWCLKPISSFDDIQTDALRINGHKIEDLRGFTKEGRERYQDPAKVLVEIENWLLDDGARSEERVLVGQNIQFDLNMLLSLWKKCNTLGTFPFSARRSVDTMGLEFAFDLAKGEMAEGYSLKNLTKKYNVTNSKAHSAAADVKATVEVFEKQLAFLKKAFSR
jgi:DNA polymerase III alpha subunit (gram-positive type)